jgi:phosphatidylserine/phosphatidylglycerophosphate/cardiolipin synthase-like enzyme
VSQPLLSLAPSDLRAIALALNTGRLQTPYSVAAMQRFLSGRIASEVATALEELGNLGMSPVAIGRTLEMLAASRAERPPIEELVDLVTTQSGDANRDTSVVVRELFHSAQRSVLVAGYAVYQGQKVFQALADRMSEQPAMKVRMYLNIQRRAGDTSANSELERRFAHRFRTTQWPLDRPLPEIYYDPRSLSLVAHECAALHAKCVVVDNTQVFVSSANFTEAAQQRNIEIGLVLRSTVIADRITQFFEQLAASGLLKRVI